MSCLPFDGFRHRFLLGRRRTAEEFGVVVLAAKRAICVRPGRVEQHDELCPCAIRRLADEGKIE